MTDDRLSYQNYDQVALEIARRTGNANLGRSMLIKYVEVGQSYGTPLSSDEAITILESIERLERVAKLFPHLLIAKTLGRSDHQSAITLLNSSASELQCGERMRQPGETSTNEKK